MFLHKFHKVVCNDGWPPTALFTLHVLSTCCKLSAPVTHHLLARDIRLTDPAQLTMNFDRRYALYIQKLYHCTPQSARVVIRASIFNHCNDASVKTREVLLVHASCDIITLSRTLNETHWIAGH